MRDYIAFYANLLTLTNSRNSIQVRAQMDFVKKTLTRDYNFVINFDTKQATIQVGDDEKGREVK